MTAWPCGQPQPNTSNLNYAPGQTIANLAVVGLGTGGKVCITTSVAASVLVDLDGLVGLGRHPGALGGHDRRVGCSTPARCGSSVAAGSWPSPSGAARESPCVNLTVTAGTAGGWLTAWPCTQPRPGTSNLNYAAGQTIAGTTFVPPGDRWPGVRVRLRHHQRDRRPHGGDDPDHGDGRQATHSVYDRRRLADALSGVARLPAEHDLRDGPARRQRSVTSQSRSLYMSRAATLVSSTSATMGRSTSELERRSRPACGRAAGAPSRTPGRPPPGRGRRATGSRRAASPRWPWRSPVSLSAS